MREENLATSEKPHCHHCGKNLSLIRKKHHIVDADRIFCCQSCKELYAHNSGASRKGKWSKTRSPFVSLKKVLT